MSKAQKYYVVWHGYKPGIYHTWVECLAQVKAFPNARYKAFSSLEQARDAYESPYENNIKAKSSLKIDLKSEIKPGSIAVDAACSGNPGDLEYRGVDLQKHEEIFRVGPFSEGTNNIGEFLAIVHALAYLKKKNDSKTTIYSDSRIAINWIKRKQPNSKIKFTKKNEALQNLMERAVDWLLKNKYDNQILKWETERWGENPADFGRK